MLEDKARAAAKKKLDGAAKLRVLKAASMSKVLQNRERHEEAKDVEAQTVSHCLSSLRQSTRLNE